MHTQYVRTQKLFTESTHKMHTEYMRTQKTTYKSTHKMHTQYMRTQKNYLQNQSISQSWVFRVA